MTKPTTTSKPNRGDKITIHIDRLSVGGRGVGRAGELVIFVPDVAPDEDVEIEIVAIKKNFAEGRLLTVLKASAARIQPPCPVAGVCGGCNWQHVSYVEQLLQKRSLVRESLRKFSGFDVSQDSLVHPVVASPKPLRYRNRVQFHHANGELGYFRRNSHQLVSIDDCPIAETQIAALIPSLKREMAAQSPGRIEVFVADNDQVHVRGPDAKESDERDQDDQEGGLGFAFSQVNTQQNRNLVASVVSKFVMKFLDHEKPVLYDLYAGSGNFTFPLANAFPKASITAVELNRESVARGEKQSAEKLAGRDIRWELSDVGAFLLNNELAAGSGILIDPPRTGCSPDVIAKLVCSPFEFLIYVSCHPVTLARDLKPFAQAGFMLESVEPFDMFPQTDHVETLVVLTRSPSV